MSKFYFVKKISEAQNKKNIKRFLKEVAAFWLALFVGLTVLFTAAQYFWFWVAAALFWTWFYLKYFLSDGR